MAQMMLRIIIRTDNMNHAAHVDGPVVTSFKTFDIEAPVIEQFLKAGGYNEDGTFLVRHIVGVEELPVPAPIDPRR